MSDRSDFATAKRVVVKVGSSSLTDTDGRLNLAALRQLVNVLAQRRLSGCEVVLVSSGAIAAGLDPLGLPSRPKDLATAQAAASVGQGILVARYTKAFAAHQLTVGQVLLTAEDVMRRGHYRNAQRTLTRLLGLGVVPIVNENDTVATEEIRFGDNDRLAALVAHLVRADALVLLTDVDGLYDAPPSRPGAQRIPIIENPLALMDVEVTGRGSDVGTGGMVTKVEAATIASSFGIPVMLAAATQIQDALAGKDVGTYFPPSGPRRSARLLWLAHAAASRGRLVLDDGAVRAVTERHTSLLAAGIVGVTGDFVTGDPVELVSQAGVVVARGLAGFDSVELPALLGKSTRDIGELIGAENAREVVHADDLVVLRRGKVEAS